MLTEPDIQVILNDESRGLSNRFSLISLLRKRATSLVDGSPPLIRTQCRNPVTISLYEIQRGCVRLRQGGPPDTPRISKTDAEAAALAKALGVPEGLSES